MHQDERLDVLPNGSHLAFGNYSEASRPLKRVLKQVKPAWFPNCNFSCFALTVRQQ